MAHFEKEAKQIEEAFAAYITAQVNSMQTDNFSSEKMLETITHNISVQIIDMLRFGFCFLTGRLPVPDEVDQMLKGAGNLFRQSYAMREDLRGPTDKKDLH